MLKVPIQMPKYCNKCLFGRCAFSRPLSSQNYGYQCQLEFERLGRYKTTLEAPIGENIKRPNWCYLEEIEEEK